MGTVKPSNQTEPYLSYDPHFTHDGHPYLMDYNPWQLEATHRADEPCPLIERESE